MMQLEVQKVRDDLRSAGENALDLSLSAFTKGFISWLVANDVGSVRPHHPVDRQGFSKVVVTLDEMAEELDRRGQVANADEVVQVANELRESNTGGFEGFEAALRAQQLTLSRCPNPFYEEIEFPIPKIQAIATINDMGALEHEIVKRVTEAFVAVRRP